MRVVFAVALLFALIAPLPAQQTMEVIPLKHRLAEQVLPALRPMLEQGAVLTSANNTLFLRASARNREEIRRALAALDTPLRRLVITVKTDNQSAEAGGGALASGQIELGRARVELGREPGAEPDPARSRGLRAQVWGTRGTAADRGEFQVQVVEGGQALIRVGSALLLPLRQVFERPGGGRYLSEHVAVIDVGSSFVARPELLGDQVTLEISPEQQAIGRTDPVMIQGTRMATTVSVRLGEWIALGGSQGSSSESDRGVARYGTREGERTHRIYLRVDELR